MSTDRFFMVFAGVVVLVSALLTWLFSPWWLLLAVFIGVHLIQAAFTGFCPLIMVLKAMGLKPGEIFP
ncbi:MAG: YgaP family membrane protein [Pseudomonadota bacterium]